MSGNYMETMRRDFLFPEQAFCLPEGSGCYDGPGMRQVVERCFGNSGVRESHALFLVDMDDSAAFGVKGGKGTETLLSHVASVLHRTFRRSDSIGRMGRHAFLVLLRNVEAEKFSEKKVREFREELNRHLAVCDERAFGAICSIGVARYPEDGKTFDEVFRRAASVLQMTRRGQSASSGWDF